MIQDDIDPMRPRKAVLYLRVSSKKQTETAADIDKDGNSIATQRDICEQKAGSLNASIVHEFVEPGVSAQTIEKRPIFKDMMQFLTDHRDVDYVIVYARSRAFRNFVDAAITRRHLDKLGIRLMSAREDFGEGTYAEAMEAVTDIMNQVQNQLSGEDIRIKMRNKAINGGTVTKAKLGYLNIRKDFDGRLINTVGLDDRRAPLVLQAFELYASGQYSIDRLEGTMADLGLTTRRTARYPEQPVSASKLHAMLKDPYYVGFQVFKGDIYPGRHEPIVGQELFDQVQDVMRARSGSGTRDRVHNHYLKGMLFCYKCRAKGRTSRMIYVKAKGRGGGLHEYFFCRARQDGYCDMPYQPAYIVEDAVIAAYEPLRLQPAFSTDLRSRLTKNLEGDQLDTKALIASLTKQRHEVQAKEARIVTLAADGILNSTQVRQKLHELIVQKNRIDETLASVESKIAAGGRLLDKMLGQLTDPKAVYESVPDNIRRMFNDAYFNLFWVIDDGSVHTDIAEPLWDILAAQHAYYAPVVAPTTPKIGSTGRPCPDQAECAIVGDSGLLVRQFINKNGADLSTPSLFTKLKSVYSNDGSNKATLVGLTGFEPATP